MVLTTAWKQQYNLHLKDIQSYAAICLQWQCGTCANLKCSGGGEKRKHWVYILMGYLLQCLQRIQIALFSNPSSTLILYVICKSTEESHLQDKNACQASEKKKKTHDIMPAWWKINSPPPPPTPKNTHQFIHVSNVGQKRMYFKFNHINLKAK